MGKKKDCWKESHWESHLDYLKAKKMVNYLDFATGAKMERKMVC